MPRIQRSAATMVKWSGCMPEEINVDRADQVAMIDP